MTEPAPPPSALERLLGETEPVRRALYPIVVAVVALLVTYGVLDAETVPLWLALAAAVLGIGGVEAARRVAYAPATVAELGEAWQAGLDDEYARGVADGAERTPDTVALGRYDDTPGEHAADRSPEVPTAMMRAPSRATRCREVEHGARCLLARDHAGPHRYPI